MSHVATPFARQAIARIEVDTSLAETVALVLALREGDHVQWRDGLIAVNRDTPWPDPDLENSVFGGRTFGVFPGVTLDEVDTTWHHEMVHVIQSQQIDSVETPVWSFGGDSDGSQPGRLFAFRHVRAGFVHAANLPTFNRRYENRWGEIEAWGLAEKKPVRR